MHAPAAVGDLQRAHVLEQLRGVEAQAAHAEGGREPAEQLREVHRRDEVGATRVEGEPLALELRRVVGGDG